MTNTSARFIGLSSFREEDSPAYFGREDEIERGIERLIANGFLAIVGPSGIGKSSLIRAGIIPKVRQNYGTVIQPIAFCRFGSDPIANLAEAAYEMSRCTNSRSSRPPSSTLFACRSHKLHLNACKNKALVFWPKPSCSDTLFR